MSATVQIGDLTFPRAWAASGARNFFDEGWPHHRLLGPFKPNFRGSTFVTKTATWAARSGNMPLTGNLRPKRMFPDCVVVDFRKGYVLNAVGLSNPGITYLAQSTNWVTRTEPFVISLAAPCPSIEAQLYEFEQMARMLWEAMPGRVKYAIEVNWSCPNTEHDPAAHIAAVPRVLSVIAQRCPGRPIIVKVSPTLPTFMIQAIAEHVRCDAISLTNTIPWGAYRDVIDWKKLFGTDESPLARYGGGGLSGEPIFYFAAALTKILRQRGVTKPIIAGGGVLHRWQAKWLLDVGANAVSLGSVAILRPWRVAGLIDYINDERVQPEDRPRFDESIRMRQRHSAWYRVHRARMELDETEGTP